MILDALASLLVLLAVVNVTSTLILVLAAVQHNWAALRERATQAVILAFAAIGGALLGLSRLKILSLPPEASTLILVGILFAVSLPSLIWLLGYYSGRFDQ